MSKSQNNLTQERVLELFDYDAENGWLIRKKDNHGRVVNRPCGNKPGCAGYGLLTIDGKTYRVHRVIWLWCKGSWPENEIDHLDRNRMNNRINNLQDVEHKQNQQNIGRHSDNSSGFPGVSWHKRAKKYRARIEVDDKDIYLGYFNTAEEAYRAYQLAKIKYHPNSPIAQQYRKELGLD